MSKTLEYKFDFVLTELLSLGLPFAPNPSVVHRPVLGKLVTDDTGDPPIQAVYSAEITVASNPTAIDLTAVTDWEGDALDLTGLKVNFIYMRADPANHVSNFIAVDPSAANGYNLFGASGLVTLGPGDTFMQVLHESLPVVASGAKSIDFASATATNKIIVVLGAGVTA